MSTIQEKRLGQLAPSTTAATSIYSPPADTTWVGKNMVVCNTTGGSVNFSIYHDETGTTYTVATALYYSVAIAANTTVSLTGLMAGYTDAGNVAVQTSSANALTFSFYGCEIT